MRKGEGRDSDRTGQDGIDEVRSGQATDGGRLGGRGEAMGAMQDETKEFGPGRVRSSGTREGIPLEKEGLGLDD